MIGVYTLINCTEVFRLLVRTCMCIPELKLASHGMLGSCNLSCLYHLGILNEAGKQIVKYFVTLLA